LFPKEKGAACAPLDGDGISEGMPSERTESAGLVAHARGGVLVSEEDISSTITPWCPRARGEAGSNDLVTR